MSLINSLNESIKEYYKVSKNNINQANSILILYDQQAQAIINLMNLIVSTSSYDKLNELFEQIPKILEVIKQMKIIYKKMKNQIQQKRMMIYFYIIHYYYLIHQKIIIL